MSGRKKAIPANRDFLRKNKGNKKRKNIRVQYNKKLREKGAWQATMYLINQNWNRIKGD
tara:strand:+ start:625 stop:801 length:177 start_codon:yes stop_codon:yes gene_type:complete